jgi:hypothetical protein
MRYTVFHYVGTEPRGFSRDAFLFAWPGQSYRRVAEVEAPSLDAAFNHTQHGEEPWTSSSRVTLSPADALRVLNALPQNSSITLGVRSTSVGDIFVDEAGNAHGVAPFGFEPLGKVAEAITSQLQVTRAQVRSGQLDGATGFRRVCDLLDFKSDCGVV